MPQPTTRARVTGFPGYSETLPRRPESAAVARRLVRAALAVWTLNELADNGALVVSELVSNAEEVGRGLLLVTALATRWGCDERGWGKIVWAELEARR
ncbi:hypothetical protein ACPCIU_00645 [Streptomyces seoulensis]|uniref:hypothetical protein n=1 Tax=Streptomyces seoulensis TaxID=73044 RepID=UPI003C2D2DB1